MNNFTSHEVQYNAAVALLRKLDYDLADVYKQHAEKLAGYEASLPTDLDVKYQLSTPKSWAGHYELVAGDCPEFSTSTIRVGGQFTLSAGQRKVLKDLAGLTPTRTITITDLELFPNSQAVRRLAIRSNQHIPDNRKHVLISWTITSFGDFMQRAHDAEVTIAATKVADEKANKPGKVTKPTKTIEQIAADYI